MTNAMICAVLVNFNGVNDTIECVQSLLKCSYKQLHIIIVDNGSGYGKISYSDLIPSNRYEIIYTGENLGFAGANNIGIRRGIEIGADYFLILNNDTIVDKDFLNPLLNVISKDASIGIATGKIYYYDDPNYLWFGGSHYDSNLLECKIDGIGKKDNIHYSQAKELPFATGCFWLMPRKTITVVGYISEYYFLYYEDADYCERVKKAGLKIWYEPASIIYHKESRSTKKGSKAYKYYTLRNYLLFLRKYNNKKKILLPQVKRMVLSIKDIIRGRSYISAEYKAWRDYFLSKTGKME